MFDISESYAKELDRSMELSEYRDGFYIPEGVIYLLGNSLGLMCKKAESNVEKVMMEWREMGIKGWLGGDPPWFYYAEKLGEKASRLVGAKAEEVVCTGTTTVNIHQLVSTFYKPKKKTKIMADVLNFPTDIYALRSQIEIKGLDPEKELLLIESDDSRTLDEEKIVEMMSEKVNLILLPSVLYRSGQLLDMEYLTKEAHKRDILIGFDCSHSVGVVPHQFDDWNLDFAVWCSYKYMNGGPGSPAFLYINERHFDKEPGLAGWFGYVKKKQFDMLLDFRSEKSAGGLQISSPSIPGFAMVDGALDVLLDAGIDNIRKKSEAMTSYLMDLVDGVLSEPPYNFHIGTPRDINKRGGHVALEREDTYRINLALYNRSVVTDFRPPNVLRLAISPLYNTYHELWQTVDHLKEIIDSEEHLEYSMDRAAVT